ncbi:PhoH family protein [Geitlerinema sp. PCC 9228]|jgi:phosphate starvation-inducible PhoH-like protein|uniref:PhoH family protein n=1 Tax=Geitlerinema sp. PCC 9228 TaxID=111611 RepID=UPI0008F9E0B0|nr:PhoH family protein [Geitlerinema sp. PCC 9228]
MVESQTISLPSIESAIALAGKQEANLKTLSAQTGATVVLRGSDLYISGTENQVRRCQRLVRSLQNYWQNGQSISSVDIVAACQAMDTERQEDLEQMQQEILLTTRRGDRIRPRTFRQRRYIQSMQTHDLTFCIGPAGTGKTYLAALLAIKSMLAGDFERLILTRPAIEAGEHLGFLPGDLQQKIDPYLRPLYDALYEGIDPEKVESLMERGIIEVAPLAYMRGRTLNNAFVILDEAQNTTPAQMKMFLTRLGFHSRMVVTGDKTQTDLPGKQMSGLDMAIDILESVEGIAFCYLSPSDVVRHPLVQKIVNAYEKSEQS